MRREEQLLLYCARTHLNEEKVGKIRRILNGYLDWNYILERGASYGISSLLFHNFKTFADKHTIPESAMKKLKQFHHSVGLRNLQIYSELRKVLEYLDNEGIPAILLKGVALAETIYPDIALRPMSDIDLLVKKADLHAAEGILSNLGYVPSSKYPTDWYENHHHLVPYIKPSKFVKIDVHHNIAPEPIMSDINVDNLWKRAQMANIAGINAFVLSPENLILHLCLHFSNDFFVDKIRILVDISEAIRQYNRSLNWNFIIRKSNEYKVGGFVYYSLYLAQEMMDVTIPTYVLKNLKQRLELKPFEAKLLSTILRKNILRSQDSFFPSWFIASLCREFFYTSERHNKVRNILKIISRSTVGKYCKRFHDNS